MGGLAGLAPPASGAINKLGRGGGVWYPRAAMMVGDDIPEPRRVLIIKPSALGDVVTALPVLRGLRRTFGADLQVDWMLSRSCMQAVAEDPELDGVVEFDRKRYGKIWCNPSSAKDFIVFCRRLRSAKYDWVLDLQGLFRSGFLTAMTGAPVRAGFGAAREFAWAFYNHRLAAEAAPVHTVDRNIALANSLGIDARAEDFRLTVGDSARIWAEGFSADHGDAFIVVAPATRWATKLYPPEHWRKVVGDLAGLTKIVLVAGPDERDLTAPMAEIGNVVDMAGRTSLPELIALIAASRGVISCDSATMNIATALKVPQVTLIGPTDPARTGPYGAADSVVRTQLPCRGCLKRTCSHISCMQTIAPAEVVAAADRILSPGPPIR